MNNIYVHTIHIIFYYHTQIRRKFKLFFIIFYLHITQPYNTTPPCIFGLVLHVCMHTVKVLMSKSSYFKKFTNIAPQVADPL